MATATATKSKNKAAGVDPRVAAIERLAGAKVARDERNRVTTEAWQAARKRREEHEYERLIADEAAKLKAHQAAGVLGTQEIRDATKQLEALMPDEIKAAIQGIQSELADVAIKIGRAFDSRPAAGTRESLLRRRDELEAGEKELKRIVLFELDWRPGLKKVLDEIHLLITPPSAPIQMPITVPAGSHVAPVVWKELAHAD